MLAFTPNQQYNDGMNKTCVILKKEMNLSDGRKVVTIFEVTDDIVTVCVADWEPVPLPWDTIPDVEQLSILFGDHVVCVLSKLLSNSAAYTTIAASTQP
jgi:hypothetical protein